MNKYQSAIVEIKDHTEHNLKAKISAETCEIVVQALQQAKERDKGCEYCNSNCRNCKHDVYDDFCKFYSKQGCSKKHYEPRSSFCSECGRDLRKGGDNE